jgi:hypothetical protein
MKKKIDKEKEDWKFGFLIIVIIILCILLWLGGERIEKFERYSDCVDSCMDDLNDCGINQRKGVMDCYADYEFCIALDCKHILLNMG